MEPDFENLLNKTLPFIKRRCGIVSNRDYSACQDLISSSLERIWRYRNKFKGNETDFRKWCSVIIKNEFVNIYRKESKVLFVDMPMHLKSESFCILSKIDNLDKINEIIGKVESNFNDAALKCFKTYFIEGYTQEETAEKLGIPLGSVKSKVYRVFDFLYKSYGINQTKERKSIR